MNNDEYDKGFDWAAGQLLRQKDLHFAELRLMVLGMPPTSFNAGALAAIDRFEELTK